jgi:hypothetical protein
MPCYVQPGAFIFLLKILIINHHAARQSAQTQFAAGYETLNTNQRLFQNQPGFGTASGIKYLFSVCP